MGCHISGTANHQTQCCLPFLFRAHVALMGGSFGFEMHPTEMTQDEHAMLPSLISLAGRVSPLVVDGDLYRLVLPEETNWHAIMYLAEDGSRGAYLIFPAESCFEPKLAHVTPAGLTCRGDVSHSRGKSRSVWEHAYELGTSLSPKRKLSEQGGAV